MQEFVAVHRADDRVGPLVVAHLFHGDARGQVDLLESIVVRGCHGTDCVQREAHIGAEYDRHVRRASDPLDVWLK